LNVAVRSIAKQLRGVSYAKLDARNEPGSGYLPILRANNITDEGLTFSDLVYVPAARVSKDQRLQRGDVLIAASSGSLDVVGKAGELRQKFDGGFGAFCKVLRPDVTAVDPVYFSHYFRTQSYRRKISSLAAGANINNLKNEHLDDLEFPLPSLDEQRRIAAILDMADSLRRKRKRVLKLLGRLTDALVAELLDAPQSIHLGDVIAEGPTNGLYKPSKDYGKGVPILRINNFYDGRIVDLLSLRRLSVTDKELSRFKLTNDDIVMNRVNSLEYLGKSAIVRNLREPTVYESNMMRFSLNKSIMLPEVCIALLQTPDTKRQILAKAKNAVNQSSINQGDVCGLRLALPRFEIQQRFVTRTQKIAAFQNTALANEASLDSLFVSLQSRAFSAQL
jgi:type I restriction enzyme S subunit